VVRRQAIVVGMIAMLVAGAVMAFNVVRHGQAWIFRNDAEFFWVVARHPFGRGEMFRHVAGVTGSAYRFGRPLYPVLAWLVAAGRPGAVRNSMMVVELAAFGGMVAAAAELLARRGRRPFDAMAILLVPGVWWAVIIAISEPVVMLLVLVTFLLHADGHRRATLVTAALVLLARESAGLALVPLVWDDVVRFGWRRFAPWVITAVPLLLWWVWVRVRIGQWPFLDRSESRRGALDVPLRGYVRAPGAVTAGRIVGFVLVGLTVVGAIWVWRRHPWFPVTHAAVLLAVLLLFLGPNATRFPGETLRLMMPAQLLVAMGLIAGNRRSTHPPP
jgi:hypothetical protein